MTKRARRKGRPKQAAPPIPVDPIVMVLDELAALWPRLADSVERDSGSVDAATADRRALGGSKSLAMLVNTNVLEVQAIVEIGLREFEAEAERILRLTAGGRTVEDLLARLPDWYDALQRHPEAKRTAEYLGKDAERWLRQVRQAIGLKRRDEPLGLNCPDHRDEKLTGLVIIGASAKLAPSLLSAPPVGPPPTWAGPVCVGRCVHPSCADIRQVEYRQGPWVWHGGRWTWFHAKGDAAFEWEESREIRCPHCRCVWKGTAQRRVLAMQLKGLGDKMSPATVDRLMEGK